MTKIYLPARLSGTVQFQYYHHYQHHKPLLCQCSWILVHQQQNRWSCELREQQQNNLEREANIYIYVFERPLTTSRQLVIHKDTEDESKMMLPDGRLSCHIRTEFAVVFWREQWHMDQVEAGLQNSMDNSLAYSVKNKPQKCHACERDRKNRAKSIPEMKKKETWDEHTGQL